MNMSVIGSFYEVCLLKLYPFYETNLMCVRVCVHARACEYVCVHE